jgi:hypothetical protein
VVAAGRVAVVTVSKLEIVSVNGADAVWLAESVTVAVKLAVPVDGDGPETRPAEERLRPTAVRLLVPAVLVLQV